MIDSGQLQITTCQRHLTCKLTATPPQPGRTSGIVAWWSVAVCCTNNNSNNNIICLCLSLPFSDFPLLCPILSRSRLSRFSQSLWWFVVACDCLWSSVAACAGVRRLPTRRQRSRWHVPSVSAVQPLSSPTQNQLQTAKQQRTNTKESINN